MALTTVELTPRIGTEIKITIDPRESPGAEYLKGSFFRHIDGASDDVPNFAATLNAKSLSRTGGSTYFANTYAAYMAHGRALLTRLREWSTQPQFDYRHDWQPGDLLIRDNTGTMHRVDAYPLEDGRLMHRTTIEAEEELA
jgi:alpha-ketoglutarate-dependent taurine dioxygenase